MKKQRLGRRAEVWLLRNPITGQRELHTLTEWAEITGIPRTTLTKRIELRWPDRDLLRAPRPKRGPSQVGDYIPEYPG